MIAALASAHKNWENIADKDKDPHSDAIPASQILISATPDEFYISIAEIPRGWLHYVRHGSSEVCPLEGKLDPQNDRMTVQEYGPFEWRNRVHLKSFGCIVAALAANQLEHED